MVSSVPWRKIDGEVEVDSAAEPDNGEHSVLGQGSGDFFPPGVSALHVQDAM